MLSAMAAGVRAARVARGLTQPEVAAAAGVSVKMVSRVEAADPTTTAAAWVRVAAVVGMRLQIAEVPTLTAAEQAAFAFINSLRAD